MPLPRDLRPVQQSDIEKLLIDQETEGPSLDFKQSMPPNWDSSSKNSFLADVSAFANASGGDLIYGIGEDGEGRATSIEPLIGNPDALAMQLQNFLRDLVEPRIPACEVVPVQITVGDTRGFVMIIRCPKSWAGPHRVKINQHFYLREGVRTRQLDVPEIRGLFLRTESQAQHIRDFRTDRISQLLTGDVPSELIPGSIMVLHLIPTSAALGEMAVDPAQYV